MPDSTIVTRFAPSPTGYLHVGGARTALFNWLLARHSGGKFLLRIEDTDLARSTEQATKQLIEDLKWLGLHWDNAELVYQSNRLPIYNKIIDDLFARGLAYKAYETAEELDVMRKDAEKHKRSFLYRRPKLTDEQIRQYESEGRPHVVRFAMPVKEYYFADVVLGEHQGVGPSQVQDFVIRKSDGMPTYHFAVVVDDAEMGITHILRGQEHLLNTVNHIALQEALGYARPTYAHLPVILNADGSKMGKRDRDKKIRHAANNWLKNTKKSIEDLAAMSSLPAARLNQWISDDGKQLDNLEQHQLMPHINLKKSDLPEILVHDFRANGYLPGVLLNFLALLGWNPGDDLERMSVDELKKLFSLDRIGKSNSKFDRQKLLSFNTQALASIDRIHAVKALRDYLEVNPDSPLNRATDEELNQIIGIKTGFRSLRDIDESSNALLLREDELTIDPKALEKINSDILKQTFSILSDIQDWTMDSFTQSLDVGFAQKNNLKIGQVLMPIRVAIFGKTQSTSLFESMVFLGKARSLARIEKCVQSFSS